MSEILHTRIWPVGFLVSFRHGGIEAGVGCLGGRRAWNCVLLSSPQVFYSSYSFVLATSQIFTTILTSLYLVGLLVANFETIYQLLFSMQKEGRYKKKDGTAWVKQMDHLAKKDMSHPWTNNYWKWALFILYMISVIKLGGPGKQNIVSGPPTPKQPPATSILLCLEDTGDPVSQILVHGISDISARLDTDWSQHLWKKKSCPRTRFARTAVLLFPGKPCTSEDMIVDES